MLEERINRDYVEAMKSRDTARSAALNYLRAMIKQVKVDSRLEAMDDTGVIAVVRRQIKQRQDSIEQFVKGGREDLAAKERAEVELMKAYLPAEISPDKIREVVDVIVRARGNAGMKDMGAVIKEAREKLGADADGKIVAELVKARLSCV